MTTTATIDRTVAVANGTNPIPFYFQAISTSEVGVLRNGLPQLGGYSVVLNGDGTGSVTPTSSWGTDPVTVYSNPTFQQQTAFDRLGGWFPDQLNDPLDVLARGTIALRARIAALEQGTSLAPPTYDGIFNIREYGAVGTGLVNDLPAIIAAYNAAKAAGGRLIIPSGVYGVNGSWTIDQDCCDIDGDGWENSQLISLSAAPAIILKSKFGRIRGFGLNGNGLGTLGLVCKDAGGTRVDISAKNFTSHGCLIDPLYGGGATGNNNLMNFGQCFFNTNGGLGVAMTQGGMNGNNGIAFLATQANGNSSGGMLLKGTGWYVSPLCNAEGNVGYGFQIGEDSDPVDNTFGLLDFPWAEGNTLGDVHSSAKANGNRIGLKLGGETYSKAAGAADVVDRIVAGGEQWFGSNDGLAWLSASANTTTAFLKAVGSGANIDLKLFAKGSGYVRAGSHFIPDTGCLVLPEIAASAALNPPGGFTTLFIDSADHLLKYKRSGGAVAPV